MLRRPGLTTSPQRLLFALGMLALFVVLVRWLGYRVAPFFLGLALFWWARIGRRELGWTFDQVGRDVLLGVAGAVLTMAGLLFVFVPLQGGDASEVVATMAAYDVSQRLLFAGIGLQAALVEESLFRGYLQRQLSDTVGVGLAVVVTASLFALSHLTWAPARLAGLLFIGVMYGVLRGRSRSLVAPATAHLLTWIVWGWA